MNPSERGNDGGEIFLKKFVKGISALFLLFMIITMIIEIEILIFAYTAKPVKSDAIIVLGCAVYGDNPSPFFQARLDEALRLYKNGYANYIIVSGGKGPGELISEARAGKDYLTGKGIPEDVILMENSSFSTYENLYFSKKIMHMESLKTAIIVSNKFHLKRASLIAKRVGIDASFSGVFVGRYLLNEIYGYIREIPGVLLSGLF